MAAHKCDIISAVVISRPFVFYANFGVKMVSKLNNQVIKFFLELNNIYF